MNNIILSGRLTRDPEVGMYQKGERKGSMQNIRWRLNVLGRGMRQIF